MPLGIHHSEPRHSPLVNSSGFPAANCETICFQDQKKLRQVAGSGRLRRGEPALERRQSRWGSLAPPNTQCTVAEGLDGGELVAGARNAPNALVVPFRVELLRTAA